jgi:hypothetical protein
VSAALELPVTVPPQHAIANAIGAALTKTTVNVELFADTQKSLLLVPKLSIERRVQRNYSQAEAERDAVAILREFMAASGVPVKEIAPEITESSSFNMIDDYTTTGRNIRVRCQARPGILAEYAARLA